MMPRGISEERRQADSNVVAPYCLRAAGAAKFLSISESSFRKLARREGLVGIRIDGPRSAVLYRRIEIEQLLDQMRDAQR